MSTSKSRYAKELDRLLAKGSYRSLMPLSPHKGCWVAKNEQKMLNLSSNDYLGIAADKSLHRLFYKGLEDSLLEKYGLGAASSRLLAGDNCQNHLLEDELVSLYDREACLLFNSGYHANIGIIPAIAGKKDLLLSDKLNHASMVDGMRLSRADFYRFHHGDYDHLRWLLNKYRWQFEEVIILSESVFSMDGDLADLSELVAIKKKYQARLYLDEAHAIGIFGKKGLGLAEEKGLIAEVDYLVGTFGKALASLGAFILTAKLLRNYLVNKSRSLIYTTALPPVVISWNRFVLGQITAMEKERGELLELSAKLRKSLVARGLETAGESNIVPVIIGDDQKTLSLAAKLQKEGFLIQPIRPPTVPKGTSRFRLSVTANMVWDDIESLASRIEILSNARED